MTHELFFRILKQSTRQPLPRHGTWKRWMSFHAKNLSADELQNLCQDPRNQDYQLSPVHIALLSARFDPAEEDLKKLDYQGNSATLYAVALGDLPALRHLTQERIHLYTPNQRGDTPLQLSIRLGAKNAIRILLQAGVDPNYAGQYAHKPLKSALIHQRYDLFTELVTAGGAVRYLDPYNNRSLLHEACVYDAYPFIKTLLHDYGLSPTQIDTSGSMPHHLAAREGHTNSLKELRSAGTDLSLPDANGWTALDAAIIRSQLPTAIWLLEQGVPLGQNQKGERIFDLLPEPLPKGIEALLFEVLNPKHWNNPIDFGAWWYAWQPIRPDLQKLKLELAPRAKNTLFLLQDRGKATRQIAKDFIALRKSETR